MEFDWQPRPLPGFGPTTNANLDYILTWWKELEAASRESGRSLAYREDTRTVLEQTGFVDITHKTIRVPMHKEIIDPREQSLKRALRSYMCETWYERERPKDVVLPVVFEDLSLSLLTRWRYRMTPEAVREMCERLRKMYGRDPPLYHNM